MQRVSSTISGNSVIRIFRQSEILLFGENIFVEGDLPVKSAVLRLPMKMGLSGLKMEDGTLYYLDDTTQDWSEAPTSIVPEIENLFRKLLAFPYPNATTRENVQFEFNRDMGTVSVRTYNDEDGDFTVACEIKAKPAAVIDEDAAFGLKEDEPIGRTTTGSQSPINFWTASQQSFPTVAQDKKSGLVNTVTAAVPSASAVHEAALLDNIRELRMLLSLAAERAGGPGSGGNQELTEHLSEIEIANMNKRVARKGVSNALSPQSAFKKRPAPDNGGNVNILRETMKQALLSISHRATSPTVQMVALDQSKQPSYMARGGARTNTWLDGQFYINILRAHRREGRSDTLESKFYLERRSD